MLKLLKSDSFFQNPYPIYKKIRDQKSPIWLPFNQSSTTATGAWMFFNHDDVSELIHDTIHVSHHLKSIRLQGHGNYYDLNMLFNDGENHRKLRDVISEYFSQKSIQLFSSNIVSIANSALNNISDYDSFDVIEDYAAILPIKVILRMLGLPETDYVKIRSWTLMIHDLTDSLLDQPNVQGFSAMTSLLNYIEENYSAAQFNSNDFSIINILYQSEQSGKLSRNEVLAMIALLLIAGNATTTALISSTLWLLLNHLDQMDLLLSDPGLIDQALNESLRFESPAQRTIFRVITQNINRPHYQISKGQQISLVIGSAHRDESFYENPDNFNISRNMKSNLAFGRGIHTCLGKHLALLEARLAIQVMLQRYPNIRLKSKNAEWRKNSIFRELKYLPVHLGIPR